MAVAESQPPQAPDLGGHLGRHDRLGQTHGAEATEGVVGGGAGGAQPGAEAAHLAEGAVAGSGALGSEAGEGGDHVIGAAAVRVQRGPVLLETALEARERLAVGGDRAERLALDGTAGQVGGDEVWEG